MQRKIIAVLWKNSIFYRSPCYWLFVVLIPLLLIAVLMVTTIIEINKFARKENFTTSKVTFTEKDKIEKIVIHTDLILFYAPRSDETDEIAKKLKEKGFITSAESFANLDDLKAKYRNVSVSPLYKWGLFGGKFVHEKKLKVKYFGVYFENMKGGLSYRIINSAPSTNTLYMNRDTIPFFKYADSEVYEFPVLTDTNILQFVVDSTYLEIAGDGRYKAEVIRRYNFTSFPCKRQIEDEMEISNIIYLIYFIRSCILLYKVATTIRSDNQSGFKEIINMHGVSKFYQEMCWFIVFYAPLGLALCVESLFFVSWFQHLGFLLFATNIFFVTCIFIAILIGIVSPNNFWVFCFVVLWTTSGFLKYMGITYQISSRGSQTITMAESILIILPPNCFKLLFSYMHYMHYIVSRSDQEVSMFFYQASYTHVPSFFALLFAMVISLLFTLMLIWYVEMVFPGAYGVAEKFNFVFTKSYWKKRAKNKPNPQEILPLVREIGVEARPMGTAPVIYVRNLSKVYGKQQAVKNINLDFYRNYITVLVGHNGSGKTTTMHMITGMVEPTSGTIWMTCPKDRMGLCHEFNLFSPEMSIFAHIRFFSMLRGTSYIDSKEEASLMLEYFDINSKVKYMPKQISYGMKRKVSLAMAVVGGSKLLILDEPTSGLDPYTKRDIWNAILKMRGAYTIVVSTHNIEEAEVLGDRIVIINDGHVLCHGSMEFLKTYYDTGYVLNILGEVGVAAEEILKEVHRFIPQANIKHVLAQRIGIFLPRVKSFVVLELMTHLEGKKQDLKIIYISFNIMNLEEIFLKSGGYKFQYKTKTFQPLEVHNKATIKGCRLFFHQLLALFFKRILYYYGEWLTMLLLLLIGLLLMYTSACMENVALQEIESTDFKLSLYKNSYVYNENNDSTFAANLKEIVAAEGSLYNETKSFDKTIKEVMLTDPFTYIEKLVVGFDKRPTLHFSKFAFHSKAVGINVLSNIYCRQVLGKECKILTVLESSRNPGDIKKTGGRYTVIILNGFASFLIFLVILLNTREEQVTGVKDLQVFSGIPKVFYWFTMYLMDIALYLVFVLFMFAFKKLLENQIAWYPSFRHLQYHIFMEFLCGTVMIPIVYMASYTRLNYGMIALICIMFIPPYIFLLANTSSEFKVNILAWIPGLTRSIAFYFHDIYHTPGCHGFLPTESDKFYAVLMAGQIIFLWAIFFLNEYGVISIMYTRQQRPADLGENDDSDVEVEEKACKRLVEKMKTKAGRQKIKPDIIVYKLYKWHTSQRQRQAVMQDISFYVPKGTCLGLVGKNGCGKSSLYRAIVGAEVPNSGRMYLLHKRSRLLNRFYIQRHIGSCPQHDALCLSLSGRQMMWIMAIIKGISIRKICHVVNLWLERVDLANMANKKISQYTKGMKKRLSVAIALLGNLPILLLDEPTEGVDPVGKRQIWNLIGWAKTMGHSIILITRSMEETEILCDKMALMVKGRFRCIGDIQYLKLKYTHGYTVTLQLRPANPYTMDDDISQIKKLIIGQYRCELKEETLSNLVYRILDEDLKMSSVFQFFDDLKSDFMIISDISVTDTSLEQLFLSIGEGEYEEHLI